MSKLNPNKLPPEFLPLYLQAQVHREALASNRVLGGCDRDYLSRIFAGVDVVHVLYPNGKKAGLCVAKGGALVERTAAAQVPMICRTTALQASCLAEAYGMGVRFGDLKREDLRRG